MIQIPNNPREIGVPHDEWRPNQLAMLKKLITKDSGAFFGELATGSGKSAIPTALGHYGHVLVVVHTLSLLTQYEQNYGFSVVRGRQEYPCGWHEKVDAWEKFNQRTPTAADCTFSNMMECPSAQSCRYLHAKHTAISAQRSACTYKYLGYSRAMKQRGGDIIFDEAHDAVEELISFHEHRFLFGVLRKFGLPKFPIAEYGEGNKGDLLNEETQQKILEWLENCKDSLVVKDGDSTEEGSRTKKMLDRLSRLDDELRDEDWFFIVNDTGFSIMGLRADKIADRAMRTKNRRLFMSATIGNPDPLASALGIEDYESYSFEHPIPKECRQIDVLNVGRMTHFNLTQNPGLYKEQAEAVYEWISAFPEDWRGAILTSSFRKIEQLKKNIAKKVNGRRLVVQEPGTGVSKVVERFIRDKREGDIMIGTMQGMGTGIDLYGDIARWIVVAGVPHVNPTDRYAKVRRDIEGGQKYQLWTVYNSVPQACGRVSRGEIVDDDYLRNYAAIADGSALTRRAMGYYPGWFKEAMG